MFWMASRKKESCFVRNNAYRVVGMDLTAAHAMEHSRLMFMDLCIVIQFLQKNPTRCSSVSRFYYSLF